jgi:hypothetical protein
MELQFEFRDILGAGVTVPKISTNKSKTGPATKCDDSCNSSISTSDKSFRKLELEVPMSDSAEPRLSWLRSQVIGVSLEFNSPFGKRRLTYADHTASGRSLHYIETFIINNVLPFYGQYMYFNSSG